MTIKKRKLLEEFMLTMGKVHREIERLSTLTMEDKIASMLQLRALTYLKDHPQSTVGELANELKMSSSAIAQFTDRLHSATLIKRVNDEKDRRVVRLVLTKEGITEISVAHEKIIETMDKFLHYISEEDLQIVVDIHKKALVKMGNK